MPDLRNNKLVSIIITNYNGKKYLEACLNSLFAQDYTNLEIILSDDGSVDDSVTFVKKYFPMVKVVESAENNGLSITSNNGAEIGRGEYLFFFNNDTIASPDLIANLVTAIEKDTDAAVASPVAVPYTDKGGEGWEYTEENNLFACGVDIYGYPCPGLSEEKIFYPDAAIFIKHKVFDEIGGFDPEFLLYGEDIDLSWRVHLMGYRIVYAGNARFQHDSGCTLIENNHVVTSIKRRSLVERQVINMMLKYYQPRTLLWLVPKFTILFSMEALFFLIVKLNVKMFFRVYVQAVWWNIKYLPKTVIKRRAIQSIRRINDQTMMGKMRNIYAKLDTIRRIGIPVIR